MNLGNNRGNFEFSMAEIIKHLHTFRRSPVVLLQLLLNRYKQKQGEEHQNIIRRPLEKSTNILSTVQFTFSPSLASRFELHLLEIQEPGTESGGHGSKE